MANMEVLERVKQLAWMHQVHSIWMLALSLAIK